MGSFNLLCFQTQRGGDENKKHNEKVMCEYVYKKEKEVKWRLF